MGCSAEISLSRLCDSAQIGHERGGRRDPGVQTAPAVAGRRCPVRAGARVGAGGYWCFYRYSAFGSLLGASPRSRRLRAALRSSGRVQGRSRGASLPHRSRGEPSPSRAGYSLEIADERARAPSRTCSRAGGRCGHAGPASLVGATAPTRDAPGKGNLTALCLAPNSQSRSAWEPSMPANVTGTGAWPRRIASTAMTRPSDSIGRQQRHTRRLWRRRWTRSPPRSPCEPAIARTKRRRPLASTRQPTGLRANAAPPSRRPSPANLGGNMFTVDEATAEAIRRAYDEGGERPPADVGLRLRSEPQAQQGDGRWMPPLRGGTLSPE
jgi:hypothetical protein